MSNTTSSVRSVFRPRGKGLLFILGGISMLITVGIVFAILSTVTQTTKYYVLSHDVKARDQITAQDLQEVTISANGAPRSYGLAQVQQSQLFAKYNLSAGDVLSDSNVTDKLTDIRAGLPTNYVVASFTAAPASAASGKIQSGDYVDLYVINDSSSDQNTSHMFLQHVLVLDAQANLDNANDSTAAADTSSTSGTTDAASGDASAADAANTRQGIPSLFTVGLSQENAARLILADSKYTISVVLSSQAASDADTNKALPGTDVGASSEDIFSGEAPDGGQGTSADPTSTSVSEGSTTGTVPTPSASASATPGASSPAPSASAGAQ
jgi:Flp pilus assembly protein CpaB